MNMEPEPEAKLDRQKVTFSLLHFLNKLDARSHAALLPDLLVLFYAVDVTLFTTRVADWLKPLYGWKQSCAIVQEAVRNWKALPLHFEMSQDRCWTVTCRSGAAHETAPTSSGGGVDDDEDDEPALPPLENYLELVQAVTEDGEIVGTVLAVLQEGDQVLLNSHSSTWWTLFEMRPRKGVVLLMHEKIKTVRGQRAKTVGEEGEEGEAGAPSGDENAPVGDANGAAPAGTTTVMVKEYKEVRLETLVGAMVRREGFISAKTYEALDADSEVDLSSALMSASKFEEYTANKVPPRGKAATFSDKSVSVLFQLPCPALVDVLRHIRLLASMYPHEEGGDALGTEEVCATRDPVWHMQHQAQVQEHVKRWEQQRRARAILQQLDPYMCLHRKQWLLLCRLLRSISNGGDALLMDYVNWTKKAGKDGMKRSHDCRAAWASVRVVTTSDLPPLAAARGYLKARGAGRKQVFFDTHGRLRPEATAADPLARNILDAAAECVTDRVLSFFSQSVQGNDAADLDDAVKNIDACTVLAPAAVYNHDCLQDLEEMQEEDSELTKRAHKIGTLVETRATPCYIAVNDALLVREPIGNILEASSDSNALRWVQVVAIDLLFARLRVVCCSAPPPHCWLPSHQQAAQSGGACWIPISKLWEVTVARSLPPASPESASSGRESTYMVFITPTPAADESLALLAQLTLEYPITPLQEQRKALFKVYAPSVPVSTTAKATEAKDNKRRANAVCTTPGRVKMTPLRLYTDAIIVSWAVSLEAQKAGKGAVASAGAPKVSPEFTLEISDVNAPREWLPVYKGFGLACQVSGLQQATQYRFRLQLAQSYPNVDKCYLMVTTLGTPPLLAPAVLKWEDGSVAENVRGLVEVFGDADGPLPLSCQWQVEGSLGQPAQEDAHKEEDEEHHNSKEWQPLARTRGKTTWIVGPFAGKSLLLRVRMVNSEGQPGPPGDVSIQNVPEKKKKKAGRTAGAVDDTDDCMDVALGTQGVAAEGSEKPRKLHLKGKR